MVDLVKRVVRIVRILENDLHVTPKCATLPWHTLEDGIQQHENGDGTVRREEL